MELSFSATVIEWRGPAPFYYALIPDDAGAQISAVKKAASYGWGVIPVEATIAGVTFSTSLFPREGSYLLPLKDKVRGALRVTVDDVVEVEMTIGSGAMRLMQRDL